MAYHTGYLVQGLYILSSDHGKVHEKDYNKSQKAYRQSFWAVDSRGHCSVLCLDLQWTLAWIWLAVYLFWNVSFCADLIRKYCRTFCQIYYIKTPYQSAKCPI